MIKVYSLDDKLEFGKHKNKTIQHVIDVEYSYITWCLNNIPDFGLDQIALKELESVISYKRLFKSSKRKNKKYYKSYIAHDPEFDAAFASCFDWGYQ